MTSLGSNLLVGLRAGLSCRGEETTTALLTTAVSALPTSLNSATKAVSDAGEQPEGNRGPHESEGLDTKAGGLAVGVELVAALDIDGTVVEVSSHCFVLYNGSFHVRNEAGGDNLEDESNPSHEGRNIASDARAHGKKSGEEGDDTEK